MTRTRHLRSTRFEGIRRRAAASAGRIAAISFVVTGATSCAPGGLQAPSIVNSVRILASQADSPYATPGASVNLTVLDVDARPNRPQPQETLYWIPFAPLGAGNPPYFCEDPASDAYYNCFGLLGAADGGTATGQGSVLPFGVDLTPVLPTGDTYTFTMPVDAITAHSATPPPPISYGLAIIFNIACAGHLELVHPDPNNVQSPPIGCFDAQHNQLGPNDYVIGFTRVYAYDPMILAMYPNKNPAIASIDQDGETIQLADAESTGITMQACGAHCGNVKIGPVVDADQQETNPEELDANGNLLKEQIYADFYTTLGSFSSDARLLYDPTTGSVGSPGDTDNQFTPPSAPGEGTMWIVVHDNRGGASWVTIPLHIM